MNSRIFAGAIWTVLAWSAFAGTLANAQEILIGHVAGYTGPVNKDATEMGAGAQVLLDAVNAGGGVLGRKLRMVTADDNFKPEETVKLIASMVGKVSALLPTTGSATLGLVLKNGGFDEVTLPIVGTIPSNESFRTPMRKNIFHFRAGDGDQIDKIVEQLTTVGIKDIAILTRPNPSGAEGLALLKESLGKRGLAPLVADTYDYSSKDNFAQQVKLMKEKKPGAIILSGAPQGIADITKALRDGGVTSLLYAVSYADFKLISKLLGPEMARGFVISQVLPNLNNKALPLVKAFHEDFSKYAKTKDEPTHFNLEGYMSARLIVEAIRRSKDASSKGVIKGLEQLHEFDMGGYIVDFSPTKHAGSRWVDLSMISGSGKLIY